MKKKLLLIVFVMGSGIITAQSKKELQAEVNRLNTELSSKEQEIREAKKNESISVAKAAEFEAQVSELQAANATLLNNLKIFTESTKQRSESIGQTLESLREKEAIIKTLNDELSKNDSLALLVLTGFKQTLGENALIGVQQGAITVELSKMSFFGNDNSNDVIMEQGDLFLGKISDIIKKYPDTEATLIGQTDSIGDPLVVQRRSLSIVNYLKKAVADSGADRISMSYNNGSTESYQLRIHPRLSAFYLRVRETIKKR